MRVLAVAVRVIAEGSRQAEDQVVPRLVREQQRPGTLEELGRIGNLDNLHRESLRCLGNA
jgi:hypothetical protein